MDRKTVMKAEEIMRPADADIHVDHNLCEAQARFESFERDRLLVIDGDEVVGVLQHADLPEDRDTWDGLTIQEVMHAVALPTCGPDDDQGRVAALLDKHPFVLVVDGEREIVGIIERDTPPGGGSGQEQQSADPTGGRSTRDGEGRLHVYSTRPHVRRLREPR